jgi:hypothetical protein
MALPQFLKPYVNVPVHRTMIRALAKTGANALTFMMQAQLQSEWCWAATSASVNAFYNHPSLLRQCEVAGQCLKMSCCSNAEPCNQPYYLDRALTETGNMAGSIVQGSLSFADIVTEIDAGRPVCCHISWKLGGGHFNAIYGYNRTNQDLNVGDPFYGNQAVPFATFLLNYRNAGSWDYSYRTTLRDAP